LRSRKKHEPSIFTLLLLLILLLKGSTFGAATDTIVATVERVSDGDTIIAFTSNQTKLRLRFLDIDAPEVPHGKKPGQPYGEKARDYLDHRMGGKTVRVDAYGPYKYKRVLAVVWDEQVNVNLLIAALGYAEVYWGTTCQTSCQELDNAEAKATLDGVGMWVHGGKYESPAEFRRRIRFAGIRC